MREITNLTPNPMIQIQILKNDAVIKTLSCVESKLQSTFNRAHNIAGGMWNGTDVFTIVVNK
jgi:hypothetical protein